jgi:predicted nucleic acid-binding protein
MTESLVLLDNTVLSNFSVVQQPGLAIAACPGRACTTNAALAEYLAAPGEKRFAENAWRDLPIIELTESERQLAEALPASLGTGERTCLAVTIARRSILATDDLHARRVAAHYGAKTAGTVGLLVMAIEARLVSLDQANALLAAMIVAGYRSPVESLDALLRVGP